MEKVTKNHISTSNLPWEMVGLLKILQSTNCVWSKVATRPDEIDTVAMAVCLYGKENSTWSWIKQQMGKEQTKPYMKR